MTDSNAGDRWYLYMVQTARGALYTGITTDVTRRVAQHQRGKGARALRGKGELRLVFHCLAGSHSQALRLEYRVKQLNRQQKIRLLQDPPAHLASLRAQTAQTTGD